jgi:hypothetical protein
MLCSAEFRPAPPQRFEVDLLLAHAAAQSLGLYAVQLSWVAPARTVAVVPKGNLYNTTETSRRPRQRL